MLNVQIVFVFVFKLSIFYLRKIQEEKIYFFDSVMTLLTFDNFLTVLSCFPMLKLIFSVFSGSVLDLRKDARGGLRRWFRRRPIDGGNHGAEFAGRPHHRQRRSERARTATRHW